jgi:parvulin-like peptidyl-prolyl isomerase
MLMVLTGCGRDSVPERADAARPPLADTEVARVGNVAISRQAFEREWERRTDVRSKEELLQEMIRFESLLAQARAAGVDRNPEVAAAFNRMVVGKFQEEQLDRRGLDSIPVSEAEVQAFYENHPERFTSPAQVRLGMTFCRASAKATPEKRQQLRQEAEALWNQASQAGDDGFRQLARQRSDDQATRYAGGDTGWFVPGQTVSRWEPEVIKAALALAQPGDLAPLVETGSGFYIVKLLGTQPASQRPLAEVRDGIVYQLRMEKAQQLRQKFFEEMQAGLAIEINRAALDAVPDRAMQTATSQPPSLPK